ncbi:MAG: hypothetical protein DI570_31495 [Phenylobacterium zucineum]|nr:MAG: hypothetical protein DI570_31495 [Phenylobacterium zucineum]
MVAPASAGRGAHDGRTGGRTARGGAEHQPAVREAPGHAARLPLQRQAAASVAPSPSAPYHRDHAPPSLPPRSRVARGRPLGLGAVRARPAGAVGLAGRQRGSDAGRRA